jgi:adenylosuccinate lyase
MAENAGRRAGHRGSEAFSEATIREIDDVIANFTVQHGEEVKAIEARTNHVKAIEYWLKERLSGNAEVMAASEFIHFACTSEDINNLSHALMLKTARNTVVLPALDEVICSSWHMNWPTCR